jgi:hypothetical protein
MMFKLAPREILNGTNEPHLQLVRVEQRALQIVSSSPSDALISLVVPQQILRHDRAHQPLAAPTHHGKVEKYTTRNQTSDRGTAERSCLEFFPPLRPRRDGRPHARQVDGRFARDRRTVAADPGVDRGVENRHATQSIIHRAWTFPSTGFFLRDALAAHGIHVSISLAESESSRVSFCTRTQPI